MTNYGEEEYWDLRYEEQEGRLFDWLEDYGTLKPIFERFMLRSDRILMLGCGNSELSEKMYDDGFKTVWCLYLFED